MKVYMPVEMAELPHDQRYLSELATIATLGNNILKALNDRTSPFSMMLAKARDEFLVAHSKLLDADLTTESGIEQAKGLQRDAVYYATLCRYIAEAREAAGIADQQLMDAEEEAAIEELKDMQYGERRAKPAIDA